MIHINLLPPEKRRPERTPIGRFITLCIGVGLVVALGLALAWLWLDVNSLEDEVATLKTQKSALTKRQKQVRDLEKELEVISRRLVACEEVKQVRGVPWMAHIDELITAIDAVPLIWITNLRATRDETRSAGGRRGRRATVKILRAVNIQAFAGGEDKSNLVRFCREIKRRLIMQGAFTRYTEPVTFQHQEFSGFVPSVAYRFEMTLLQMAKTE